MKKIYMFKMVSAKNDKIICDKVDPSQRSLQDARDYLNLLVAGPLHERYIFLQFDEGKAPPTYEIDLTK